MAKSPNVDNDPFGDLEAPNGDSQEESVEFGMRLRAAAFARSVKQSQIADGIGMARGTFGRYWHGERLPRGAQLFAIADIVGVDPRWLVEGENKPIWQQLSSDLSRSFQQRLAQNGMSPEELGEKLGFKSDYLAQMIAGEFATNPAQPRSNVSDGRPEYRSEASDRTERSSDIVDLDEIDLRYGMGGSYIDGPVSSAKRQFSREWLRQITRSSPEHLFWASGDGDSMEPTIRSQDIILIDRSQQTPRMGDGVWAIAWGEVGMIKRLRPLPDGTLELHSDNPLVRPATAVDGEVHIIGRVVAVVKRL